MSELFREIDSELRKDKARELLIKYGPRFLILSVVAVIAVVIGVYLRDQEHARQAEATAELVRIVGEGPFPDNLPAWELAGFADTTGGTVGALGKLHLAGQLARDGNIEGALKAYQELAIDRDLPDELQDLALLYSIILRMNEGAAHDELLAELEPLMNPNVAWRWSAMELTALLHIQNGDLLRGQTMIADMLLIPNLPVEMRRRLFQWSEIYGAPEVREQS